MDNANVYVFSMNQMLNGDNKIGLKTKQHDQI